MTKHRTLAYRRANWFAQIPAGSSFEGFLRQTLNILPNVDDSRINVNGATTAEIRHYKLDQGAVYVHIAAYTPGELASVVPAANGIPQADLGTTSAPTGTEFMDGDLMLRVTGDHVVLCPSNLREGTGVSYLRAIFDRAGLSSSARNFDLIPIANVNAARLIAREGVKSVRLDVALYEEAVADMEHHTIQHSLGGKMFEWFMAMTGEDADLADLEDAENLQAKLIISFDSRRSGGTLGKERLAQLANRVADEDEDGFVIETFKGERIRAHEIAMRKPVQFTEFGKTIYHTDAWVEIDRYYGELVGSGAVEQ